MLPSPSLGFSRAREPNPYPGVAEPYLEPLPQKIQKKSGAKKTSVFSLLLCQNIQFFVAGAPEHFCWILGRLGFDSFLKGSTLFFHRRKREKCEFRGSLTSANAIFLEGNRGKYEFRRLLTSQSLIFLRREPEKSNFND